MIRVYGYVVAGAAVSLLTAYAVGLEGLYVFIYLTPLFWLVVTAPLALAIIASLTAHRISAPVAHLLFWSYAICIGMSFAGLFEAYTGPELMLAFTAVVLIFVSSTSYGYFTRRDLRPTAKILLFALLGTLALSVSAAFIDSDGFAEAVAFAGGLVMAGLVACDTQHIRRRLTAAMSLHSGQIERATIVGALMLFLDLVIVSPGLARVAGFTASRATNLGRLTTLVVDEVEHVE